MVVLTFCSRAMNEGERDWSLYVREIVNLFSGVDDQLRILPTTIGDDRQQTISTLRSSLSDVNKMVSS